MYVGICVCIYAYMYACKYVYVYACMYVCVGLAIMELRSDQSLVVELDRVGLG